MLIRKALGGLVFGNADNKKQLEAIVWPAIRTLAEQRLQTYREQGTVSTNRCTLLAKCIILRQHVAVKSWRHVVARSPCEVQ
jgi:dephospho-CoA kinase